MFNKRGISPIIATVLIILLTISAAVFIYQIVIPFVRDSLYGSTRCHSYSNYFTFDDTLGFNCIDAENNFLLTLRAKTVENAVNVSNSGALNDTITGILISFQGNGEAVTAEIPSSSNVKAVPSTITVKIPNPGDLKTYNISLGKAYNTVEMHVIVDSKACDDVSDKIKDIGKC